ncbi:hypothetical protein C6341_g27898 [Phytophthora cactorum]|nr:hypothetical protein C6341_g27898 [Phytophthora cactorum]
MELALPVFTVEPALVLGCTVEVPAMAEWALVYTVEVPAMAELVLGCSDGEPATEALMLASELVRVALALTMGTVVLVWVVLPVSEERRGSVALLASEVV